MREVYISAGSNMGNREENLRQAFSHMEEGGCIILKRSSLYKTSPWGFNAETHFLNMAVEISTELSPNELLELLLGIEEGMGRIREDGGYRSRIIDLDILFYGNQIMDEPGLMVPHPRVEERLFVLVPLNEIAPDFKHPASNLTLNELLAKCNDDGMVDNRGALSDLSD